MARSNWIRSTELQLITRLIGECREQGDDPFIWRQHLYSGLARLVDADLVMGAEVRHLLEGQIELPGGTVWGLDHGFSLEGYVALGRMFAEDSTRSELWQAQVNGVRSQAGAAFVFRRQAVLNDRQWYRSFDFERISSLIGSDACLHSMHPTQNADHFDGVNLSRLPGRPKFSRREATLVALVHGEASRFVGGPLTQWNEPRPSQLPARVRQVLRCLLEGDSDKQVASRLQLSLHTVNQYTKRIYVFFGVNSRMELLAHWLRRGWTNACRWESDDAGARWNLLRAE